jgi:hypothetical protein
MDRRVYLWHGHLIPFCILMICDDYFFDASNHFLRLFPAGDDLLFLNMG